VQLARNRIEQCLRVGSLAIGGDPRLGQRDVGCAQAFGGAQRNVVLAAVKEQVHARLLVARRQQRAKQLERRAFGILGHGIVAPGVARQTFGIGAVAARQHYPRQRELALGRHR
jgi:hypothetical protein